MLLAQQSTAASAPSRRVSIHRRTAPLARRPLLLARAEEQGKSAPAIMRSGEETDNCDLNVGGDGEYCSIDLKGKRIKDRSLGEMEAEFLEALSAYYFEGKPKLTDEEFSLLKEELLWNGSKVRAVVVERARDGWRRGRSVERRCLPAARREEAARDGRARGVQSFAAARRRDGDDGATDAPLSHSQKKPTTTTTTPNQTTT